MKTITLNRKKYKAITGRQKPKKGDLYGIQFADGSKTEVSRCLSLGGDYFGTQSDHRHCCGQFYRRVS